jgi:hypothetical protein
MTSTLIPYIIAGIISFHIRDHLAAPSLKAGPRDLYSFNLDYIPDTQLTIAISRLWSSSSSPLTLSFTVTSLTHNSSSSALVLTALPFMPRPHITFSDLHRLRHFHTPNQPPLFVPFHLERTSDIINRSLCPTLEGILLACSSSKINLVRDISVQQATHIDRYIRSLTTDAVKHFEFVHAWGELGLREEVFFATWEAALLRAGLLLRYEVVVQRST